jgi:hypothetical protein
MCKCTVQIKRIDNRIDGVTFLNPTGGKIRVDSEGDGHHGAPRGSRRHKGVDFECCPNQKVLMPITGRIARLSYPYANDLYWKGVLIYTQRMQIKLWYFQPMPGRVGNHFQAGDIIGHAQDISKKYPGMDPHVHLRVVNPDPLFFFKEG